MSEKMVRLAALADIHFGKNSAGSLQPLFTQISQCADILIPARFKMEIVYFMTPTGEHGAPQLGQNEYWIRREEAIKWLDDLVVYVVSPLDARSKAEIELTDEHEAWLTWMVENKVQHVRLG